MIVIFVHVCAYGFMTLIMIFGVGFGMIGTITDTLYAMIDKLSNRHTMIHSHGMSDRYL